MSASRKVLSPVPRGGGREINRLTSSFETLIAELAEQNRELTRRQYELKASYAHRASIPFSDALTGLPNREIFESTLQSALIKSNNSGMPLAVLFIDLYSHQPRERVCPRVMPRCRRRRLTFAGHCAALIS